MEIAQKRPKGAMIVNRFHIIMLLILILAMTACGGTGEPDKGIAGSVFVADIPVAPYQDAELLIGFDSNDEFQKLKALVPDPNTPNEVYIHGLVVADSSYPLGFYLDPKTTNIPANFVPELQQSARQITEKLDSWKGQKVYVVMHVRVERYL